MAGHRSVRADLRPVGGDRAVPSLFPVHLLSRRGPIGSLDVEGPRGPTPFFGNRREMKFEARQGVRHRLLCAMPSARRGHVP